MLAERPFHGRTEDQPSNLLPIVRLFPKWNLEQAERMWCAAFVYYCCIQAGFSIPYSPQECRSCSLAGCGGWEEFAQGDKRIAYYDGQQAIRDADFVWQEGDILLYDRVFINREHDHIGILLKLRKKSWWLPKETSGTPTAPVLCAGRRMSISERLFVFPMALPMNRSRKKREAEELSKAIDSLQKLW